MEAANARAALHARVAAQRILQACSTLCLKIGGSERAFARAKMRRNVCVSFGQDHKARTRTAIDQLRVCTLCSAPGLGQDDAIDVRGTRSGNPIAPNGRHQSGVNRQLRSSIQGQIRHPAGVMGIREGQVHVSDHDVHSHSASSLPANTSSRALNRKSTPSQQPCSRACCPMVATRIQHIGRNAMREEWEAKTTEKEHAKEGRINSRQEIDRSNRQHRRKDHFESASMLSRDRPMWASPCGLCGVSPPWKPLRAATRA